MTSSLVRASAMSRLYAATRIEYMVTRWPALRSSGWLTETVSDVLEGRIEGRESHVQDFGPRVGTGRR